MGKSQISVRPPSRITKIGVSGFKSLYKGCSLDIGSLTILAGANSTGKSSIMQPLLLLKQTLEATYDPGALLLDGPNVRFSSTDQMLSRISGKGQANTICIQLETQNNPSLPNGYGSLEINYKKTKQGIDIDSMNFAVADPSFSLSLSPSMSSAEVSAILPEDIKSIYNAFTKKGETLQVVRARCFLQIELHSKKTTPVALRSPQTTPGDVFEPLIRGVIHLPGLRGNPERTYKTTAISSNFPGTFENYAASIIHHWQTARDSRLKVLGKALETLGLGGSIKAKRVDETHVELRVGRLPHGHGNHVKSTDMISMADVGFGVSQTLPIIVALLVAAPGQIVYLEQPEIHLHPRAQFALAQLLADAAQRGVRVVAETHSSLLLLGLQALVAEGSLPAEHLKLHWFKRRNDGSTEITTANVDAAGTFGDWPEDFGAVALEAESRYLDAVEAHYHKK